MMRKLIILLCCAAFCMTSFAKGNNFENSVFSFSYPDFLTVRSSLDKDSIKAVSLVSAEGDRVDVNFLIPPKGVTQDQYCNAYSSSLINILSFGGAHQWFYADDFKGDAPEVLFGNSHGKGSYYTIMIDSTNVYGRIITEKAGNGIIAIDMNVKDSTLFDKLMEIQKSFVCTVPVADEKGHEDSALVPSASPEGLSAPVSAAVKNQSKGEKPSTEKIYDVVEQMPSFEGGTTALMKFLSENTQYPAEAQEKGVQGKVVVNFVVEKDGSVDGTKVVRGVDSLLDAEAVRVVGTMPKWTPGMQDGKAVRVRYTLPISFKLSNATPSLKADGTILAIAFGNLQGMDEVVKGVIEEHPTTEATFPGGKEALDKYIAENLYYPESLRNFGIQDHVTIDFVVEKDGSISHVKIAQAKSKSLSGYAKKLVEEMPKWQPAKQKKDTVRSRQSLVIDFVK